MFDWGLILTGVFIGIAVAAPVGPVNLICIRHSLANGFAAGVLAGLGAVVGDGTFAAVAAFGLTALSKLILSWRFVLEIIGAALLIAMGLKTLWVDQDLSGYDKKPGSGRYLQTFSGTYLLTITNPATMMGFAVIFGGVGGLASETTSYSAAGSMVAAVMAGSLIWWIFLAWLVSACKKRLTARHLQMINKVTGLLILGFGVVVAIKLTGLHRTFW